MMLFFCLSSGILSPYHHGIISRTYRNPGLVKGKRVIELGAGVGAPGIAAALAGEQAADG